MRCQRCLRPVVDELQRRRQSSERCQCIKPLTARDVAQEALANCRQAIEDVRTGNPERAVLRRRIAALETSLAETQARANHLPGLSAAYDEVRSALAEATRALRVVHDSRGPAVNERQWGAMAELHRLIGVCDLALGHGPYPLPPPAPLYRCKLVKAGDGGVVDGCGWQGPRTDRCPGCGGEFLREVDPR